MGYLNETLKRASIQSLREYFFYGISDENYSAKSYEMRIKVAYDRWRKVASKYDQDAENSELETIFHEVVDEHEHVYMEMGIQAGFRLAREIDRSEDEDILYEKYKAMYTCLYEDTAKAVENLQKARKNAEEIYHSVP